MTAQETSLLIGALIALMGALQGWLVVKARDHDNKLDGLLDPRIASTASQAIVLDHAARAEVPTPVTVVAVPADPVKASRIAALHAELAELTKPP